MAEPQSPSGLPSILPQKRPPEDEHAPSVSSPLNPDPPSKPKATKEKAPIHREPREKKESLKKREAKASSVPVDGAASTERGVSQAPKHTTTQLQDSSTTAPLRYKLPPPKPLDYALPKGPVLVPHHVKPVYGQDTQFYESSEHVYNRKGFRYTHCIADPTFPSSLYYRHSETEPFFPHVNYEDASSYILFDEAGKQITTEKGFRMARANVGVREGRWYWECKITSGVRALEDGRQDQSNGEASGSGNEASEARGHVRVGWARREASLDAPVGFDAYSYGLRDVGGQKMHISRPKDFFPPGEDIREGDVIGMEIELPSLALHRKIVQGYYNPAVDLNETAAEEGGEGPDIIRDRVPIHYKAHLYFEQFEYHPTKELEEYMNPSPLLSTNSAGSGQEPNSIHPVVALRTLPNSSIKVYKNGKYVGTPFTNLLAFLPPASKPQAQVGARDGLDDGMLGYFPAISVFRGGAAEANFGPDFWHPPADQADTDMTDADADANQSHSATKSLRPVSERYNEQIAEDITYDLVDEVDFWLQDGGSGEAKHGLSDAVPAVLGPVDPAAPGVDVSMTDVEQQAGEIKEIVQEDE